MLRDLQKYVYTICVKSKVTRGEHSDIIDTGMKPGQAYGVNVTGPFAMPSLSSNVYMFANIDYSTRRVWIYFIRTRDEAFCYDYTFIRDRASESKGG